MGPGMHRHNTIYEGFTFPEVILLPQKQVKQQLLVQLQLTTGLTVPVITLEKS